LDHLKDSKPISQLETVEYSKSTKEVKKPPPMPLDEKNHLMNHLLLTYKGYSTPEIEVVQDPFTLDIDIVQAIRIIQKNDRGRQGRQRISFILKNFQHTIMQAEMVRKLREGKLQE
jgi:hypothetical protein